MSSRVLGRSIGLAAALLLACAAPTACRMAPKQAAPQEIVAIQSGQIQGVPAAGLVAFKGIPYAAPPVGELRWRPPQAPVNWQGVRSAAAYSHDCMQLPFPSDAAPLGTPPAEDCLYLNVWTPSPRAPKPMPVMVWIYGGGFVNGGSSPAVYDGSSFARDGVVFVSFNYRLGRFGFFAFPALTKEDPNGLHGNYAYMDQLAALQWVQNNIAAFGGDPNNVTVFGESAGGGSVHMLLTSPLAHGLFARAIIESGGGRKGFGGGTAHLDKPANGKPSAEQDGVAFARSMGIEGDGPEALNKLRALPAEKVVDGLNMASMGKAAKTYSGPMIDGKIVTGENSDIYLANQELKVPVMVGVNSLEMGFMRGKPSSNPFAQFGPKAAVARTAFDPNGKGDLTWTGAEIVSDRMMVEPARFVAQTLTRNGQPVYEYRFSYVASSMRKDWAGGAVHASEIPYVFDTVKARYGSALTPGDEQVAEAMHAYWVQYAKSGEPDPPGRPAWPRYSSSGDQLMNFTAAGPVPESDPWKTRLDVIETLQK